MAETWEIQQKVTTIGTYSVRTMVAAAAHLPFQLMPCVTHILQEPSLLALLAVGLVMHWQKVAR